MCARLASVRDVTKLAVTDFHCIRVKLFMHSYRGTINFKETRIDIFFIINDVLYAYSIVNDIIL